MTLRPSMRWMRTRTRKSWSKLLRSQVSEHWQHQRAAPIFPTICEAINKSWCPTFHDLALAGKKDQPAAKRKRPAEDEEDDDDEDEEAESGEEGEEEDDDDDENGDEEAEGTEGQSAAKGLSRADMEDRLEYLNRLARGEVSDASSSSEDEDEEGETTESSDDEDEADMEDEDEEGVESRKLEDGDIPMGEATRCVVPVYLCCMKRLEAHTPNRIASRISRETLRAFVGSREAFPYLMRVRCSRSS